MADGGGEQGASGGSAPVCSFVRKPPKNIWKRPAAPAGSDDDDGCGGGAIAAARSKKGPSSAGKLVFSSADASSEPRRFQYESSRTIQASTDSRATATLATETEFDRDARAIWERQLKQAEQSLKKNPSGASGSGSGEVYKGIHGYTDYKAGFRREHTVSSEKAGGAHGPLRASAHIRLSARFDYQPDICKDYKETGYCGYGDSCKFMHDRRDSKSGWQLEKEWEEAEKARKRRIAMGGGDGSDNEAAEEEEEDDDEALPFACFICRQPFVDPVVTKCKHYFYEHCALKEKHGEEQLIQEEKNIVEEDRDNDMPALIDISYGSDIDWDQVDIDEADLNQMLRDVEKDYIGAKEYEKFQAMLENSKTPLFLGCQKQQTKLNTMLSLL